MTDRLFDLDGKTVVVTGGNGQLGRQFIDTLLERGAKVASLDLRPPAEPSAVQVRAMEEGRFLAVEADITDRPSLVAAAARTGDGLGRVSGLINCAAIDSPPDAPADENGPFESYPEESFRRVMEVNVTGAFLCCQVFGEAMAAGGGGSIVNIGSIYGVVSPDQSIYEYRRRRGEVFYKPVAYSVSKSALVNMTRYLAAYWGRSGVRVNLLSLGGVFNHQEPAFLDQYCGRVPVGRMAVADEYNGAIVFLISDASSYMTGSNMVIDGGWTAI